MNSNKLCKVCGSTTDQHKMSCYPHNRQMAELRELEETDPLDDYYNILELDDETTQIDRDSEILPQ